MTPRCAALGVLALVAACSGPAQPDIVVVLVDTLRADHLGCYGYSRRTSPAIDRLAREGVRFERAFAQAAWTFASVPSLMTSRFPQDHADLWVQHRPAARLGRGSRTLPGVLRAAGYRTVLVSGHGALGAILGLREHFDRIDDASLQASEVVNRAVAELARARGRPLFLWVHLMDPHAPYLPPEPFRDRFTAAAPSRPLEPVDHDYAGFGGIPRIARIDGLRDLGPYVARYDGEVAYADSEIGRLRRALDRTGDERPVLLVIASDHGESLGENDLYFSHTYDLHDPILHVPWILWYPGRLRPRAVAAQVMLIDLAPTVAALVGVPRPAAWLGRDLGPCLRAGDCRDRDVFATRGVELAIRTSRWKLVCNRGLDRCSLFDFAGSGEGEDVAPRYARIASELHARLASWARSHPDRRPRDATSGITDELDPESLRVLRSLGYVR